MKEQIEKLAHYSVGAYKQCETRRGLAYEGIISFDGTPIGDFHNDGDGSADDITLHGFHRKAFADLANEVFADYDMSEKDALLIRVLIGVCERGFESGYTIGRIRLLQEMLNIYRVKYNEFRKVA